MTCHYFIATMKPIEVFHKEGNDFPFLSGEAYKKELPLSLPYVYEFGGEDMEFLDFLDGFMEYGDVVEHYIYEEGKWGRALSSNHPEEAKTINLYQKTYKDQYGEYQLNEKSWKEELARKTIASKRSITTFVKY
ncbi:hypothetical protein J7E38_16695 [Bacillus sp. ISL-35]|uniref:hypothetical protein n=1 Tax=Bacillus sp. ISL-35 TaxID=2819122 RepID=UPI001BE9FBFF|nr:hypothetical protein [Bacillus sp. ISL-35]MBT2680650.1 hypothetical protein [Bacillus sp. ISL-35]MBT2702719.1 hypothetical protein [Chryseobacterium sp. ISL-80]